MDSVSRPVWESNLAFIQGGRAGDWVSESDEDVEAVAATMRSSESDRERTAAAYRLGGLCKTQAPGCGAALQALECQCPPQRPRRRLSP